MGSAAIPIPQKAVSLSATPAAPCDIMDLKGVTRTFSAGSRSIHALGPIDLELRRREFLTVVGPSGCGKSTLLDILAGLNAPSDGTVRFDGRPLRGVCPDIGVVFQEDSSFPWLSVWDNAAFGLRRRGLPKAEIRERVDDALSFMGLAEFRDVRPTQLSGGMRQRLCIARTLVLQPSLILLDEPFAALDQQTRLLMGEELLRVWRHADATVVLITHSLDEAVMLSDRVAIMSARPGRIIELLPTGWPRERDSSVYEQPEFGRLSGHIWSILKRESAKSTPSRPADTVATSLAASEVRP